MLKNYSLLITACIRPDKNVPYLNLIDADERCRQYLDSALYYIKKTHVKNIVFCDNSGTELDVRELRKQAELCHKRFEFISFEGDNDKSVSYGKGYGEGEIISYALQNSQLLKESSYFVKVTGRVVVKNLDMLLCFMKNGKNYFQRNDSTNLDTRLYGISIDEYKRNFVNAYKSVDDRKHKYLENVFSDIVLQNKVSIHKFVVYPDIRGIAGSTGMSYSLPLKRRIKLTIKNYIKK